MVWVLVMAGLAVAYQLGVVALLLMSWRNPVVPPRRTPTAVGVPFEDVSFPTARGRRLHGWWIAGPGGAPRPVVILIHGWGRNVERMLPYIEMLRPLDLHLLAFDARNHGLSDRDVYASMLKFSEDIRAAIDFSCARPVVDRTRVAVLGLSIGGAAAIHAAAHDSRIRAVVTAGAFADPRSVMVALGRSAWLANPGLPLAFRTMEWVIGVRLAAIAPEAVIRRAEARFLIVHGDADRVVPVAHASRLKAAAPERCELLVMAGRGHSDLHLEPGFPERLAGFLAAALERSTSPH
jgi:uncharacterized protein